MPEKSAFRRRVTPSVPFMLTINEPNGEVWKLGFQLVFDLNRLCLFEETVGLSFLQNMTRILIAPSVTTLTTLLWVGAQDTFAGPEGLEAIRANVTLADLPAVKEACIKALLAQLPPDVAKKLADTIEASKKGEEKKADPTPAPVEQPTQQQ